MKDYTIVFATIMMFVAIFLVSSLGHFPQAFDPRYINAAMNTAKCIICYFIMYYCYRMAIAFERLLWFLSDGDERLRAGLMGTFQSLTQQLRTINKELGKHEN